MLMKPWTNTEKLVVSALLLVTFLVHGLMFFVGSTLASAQNLPVWLGFALVEVAFYILGGVYCYFECERAKRYWGKRDSSDEI